MFCLVWSSIGRRATYRSPCLCFLFRLAMSFLTTLQSPHNWPPWYTLTPFCPTFASVTQGMTAVLREKGWGELVGYFSFSHFMNYFSNPFLMTVYFVYDRNIYALIYDVLLYSDTGRVCRIRTAKTDSKSKVSKKKGRVREQRERGEEFPANKTSLKVMDTREANESKP